jgi:hypothetical protein
MMSVRGAAFHVEQKPIAAIGPAGEDSTRWALEPAAVDIGG